MNIEPDEFDAQANTETSPIPVQRESDFMAELRSNWTADAGWVIPGIYSNEEPTNEIAYQPISQSLFERAVKEYAENSLRAARE